MTAVTPEITPCRSTPRGSSDGVSERQKNTSAPASPPKHSRRRNSHRSLPRTNHPPNRAPDSHRGPKLSAVRL